MLSLKGEGQFFAFIEEKQFVFMEESKQKFAELSLLLVNTMDVGSVKAKEKAEKIIELISQWRRNCYNEILTSGSVQLLIEAIEIAKEWNTLSVTPAKKEKAKSVPSVEKDDLTSIAKGKVVLEKLDVFKGLIESKLKENDAKLAEINATKDKIAKLRSELDDLEKSKEDVARQLANDGDQAKANRAIVDIRLRKSRIETEIKLMSGNNMLVMREHTLNSNRETIMNIGSIVDMLNDNNGDLAFLAKAVDKVDFNALVEYMLGKTKNIDAARDSINRIKAEVTVLWKGIKRTSDEVKNDTNTVDEIISEHILGGLDIEEEQVNEEGLDPELAELMKKFKDEKTEEETEENKTKIKRAVPLGDDDK